MTQSILNSVPNQHVLGSIVVSIPACHAGDRGSIPRRGEVIFNNISKSIAMDNRL